MKAKANGPAVSEVSEVSRVSGPQGMRPMTPPTLLTPPSAVLRKAAVTQPGHRNARGEYVWAAWNLDDPAGTYRTDTPEEPIA